MIILGINGFPDGGHDASACIVKDGEVIVFAEEERFSREKHAYDVFPHVAIKYCLKYAEVMLDDVDYVAVSWDLPRLYALHGYKWSKEEPEFISGLFPKDMFHYQNKPICIYVDHHLAHAASTFWASGFEKSSVLVMDGQGEEACTTLAQADQQKGIQVLHQIDRSISLGYLYKAASDYIGLGRENPGKTMGLAAYGKPTSLFPHLELLSGSYSFRGLNGIIKNKVLGSLDEMELVIEWWCRYFESLGVRKALVYQVCNYTSNRSLYQHPDVMAYTNFAASVQLCVEQIARHLVLELIQQTQCPFLSLAGGVALNCSMNGVIAKMKEVKDCFIFPAAHDSGTSLGAAWEVSFKYGVLPKAERWKTCYLGPEFTNQQISRLFKKSGIVFMEYSDDELAVIISDLLCQEKIVGVFKGRSEIGPRSLGHRSILASPESTVLRDRVNMEKGRELWRPLCPSVLEQHADDYFHHAKKGSFFMLRSLEVKPEKSESIAGVVHVDNTARAQMVEADSDYGKLISAFYCKSGIPMVLNTSFNLAGEPIVGSPIDALKTFFASGMDVLILGNFMIFK